MTFEIVTNVGGVRIVEMLRHHVANPVFISGDHEPGLRHEREHAGSLRASRSTHVWQSAVEIGDEDDEGVAQAL